MKAKIYSETGKKSGELELPEIFSEEFRPDIIKKAYYVELSRSFQPKGAFELAGQQTSAAGMGPGAGRSRIPRVKSGPHRGGHAIQGHKYRSKGRGFSAAGRGAIMPGTVGGRQAHPPKPEEVLIEKINKKELRKAYRSAIAATSNKEVVIARGHKIDQIESVPIIVSDNVLKISKTSEFEKLLISLGLKDELQRSANKKIRAGKGKRRGRKYKKPKGILIILPEKSSESFKKAARNIPGVDVSSAKTVSISMLAPGANPGRLVILTKSAIDELEKRFEK